MLNYDSNKADCLNCGHDPKQVCIFANIFTIIANTDKFMKIQFLATKIMHICWPAEVCWLHTETVGKQIGFQWRRWEFWSSKCTIWNAVGCPGKDFNLIDELIFWFSVKYFHSGLFWNSLDGWECNKAQCIHLTQNTQFLCIYIMYSTQPSSIV